MTDVVTAPLVSKVLSDLYFAATAATKKALAKYQAASAIKNIHENIQHLEHVRTIATVDRVANISDFYYPPRIGLRAGPTIVTRFRQIPHRKPVLIKGVAGQGKSIFVRFLCIQELKGGLYLPILAELRRMSADSTLTDFLLSVFADYGLRINEDLFDFLVRSNRLLLILDGVDEVPDEYRGRVVSDIESLCRQYTDKINLIVTSRPKSGIDNSPFLDPIEITPVDDRTLKPLIEKIVDDPDYAERLVSILGSNPEVTSLLTTPLLVTLLAITYRGTWIIPDNMAEFYDLVFSTLVRRHEAASKPGFERERKSGLGDSAFQRAFEAVCFSSMKARGTRFSGDQFSSFAEEALRIRKLPITLADELMHDIEHITSLVLEDGHDEYQFVHKSIQEYFAALNR